MTIKQQGGIFGRNPTFNDVGVEGDLTLSGSLTLPNDSISGDAIDGGSATLEGLTVGDTSRSFSGVYIISSITGESELRMGDTDTDAGSIAYRNDTNEMTFRTNAAPRATLDGSGNFEPTGNLVVTSGKGIDFSATSGTGTSELFDDYEEGVHTATMTPATSGTVTLNASYDELQYTKIGNMVSVRGQLITSSVSSPVGGYVAISLPFTSASGTGKRAGGAVHSYGIGSNVYATYPAHITENSSSLAVFLDASTLTASDQITLSFCYQAA